MRIVKKILKKLKPQKPRIRHEVQALRRLGRHVRTWVAILALTYGLGWVTGCAAIVGAGRGLYEGARLDIAAAKTVIAPGTPELEGGVQ